MGQRLSVTAAAVADGAGHGAGALRTDMQHAAIVDPGDRATAGADAFHIDRREAGYMSAERLADPGVACPRNAPLAHKAHVVGRAAGVSDHRGIGALVG